MYPQKLQQISIHVLNDTGGEHEYPVHIVDMSDTRLLVEVPLGHKGYLVRIPDGQPLYVGYSSDGGFYQFPTRVVGYINDQVQLMELVKPPKDKITKVQRREYFRVSVMLNTTIQAEGDTFIAPLHDLSGGGLRLISQRGRFKEGDTIKGTLSLRIKGNPYAVEYEAVVRRAFDGSQPMQNLYALEFTSMTELDRSHVVRYCMDRQLELRRRA